MPKHREARVPLTECTFCEREKDDVPYLMSAPNGKAAICTDCVFGIGVENVRWASGIFKAMRADHERSKKAPPKIIVPAKTETDAITKMQKGVINGHRKHDD